MKLGADNLYSLTVAVCDFMQIISCYTDALSNVLFWKDHRYDIIFFQWVDNLSLAVNDSIFFRCKSIWNCLFLTEFCSNRSMGNIRAWTLIYKWIRQQPVFRQPGNGLRASLRNSCMGINPSMFSSLTFVLQYFIYFYKWSQCVFVILSHIA